jgi:hypothetical protein
VTMMLLMRMDLTSWRSGGGAVYLLRFEKGITTRSQLGDETDIHDSCEAPSSKILWRQQGCSLRLRYRSLRL